MQKKYRERTSVCTWEPWRTQERDAEWSAPTIVLHIHGTSESLGMTVAWRYDILRDWLWDACHMAGVRWGSCWEGFCSKEGLQFVARKACTIALSEARGTRQSTLFTCLKTPWGFLTQAVLHSLAGLMSRKKVSVWGFLWVRKVWFVFAQRTFAPETFGERWKREKSPVVSLLPGSHERLASRNPQVLCQKHWGACTTYQLGGPKVQETGQEIWFPCSRERHEEISE